MNKLTRTWIIAGLVVAGLAATARAQDVEPILADADKYYEADKYDRAAAAYDRAISLAPQRVKPEVYAKRATIFVIQKKFDAGVTWIETVAEKVYPGNALILEQKAGLLWKIAARKQEAVKVAEEVVAKKSDSAASYIIIAEYYYTAGAASAAKAVAGYLGYFAHRPAEAAGQDGQFRLKLGFSYLYLSDFGKAEEQFQLAIKAKGNSVEANAKKGLCAVYAGQEKWTQAITVCEDVIRNKRALSQAGRNDPSPYFNVGLAYLANKQFDLALQAANSYIGMKPGVAKGYVLRGRVYLQQKKLNEAEGQLNEGLKKEPTNAEAAKWLGETYVQQGRPEKAIQVLEKVVAGNPDDVNSQINLVKAYLAAERPADAATTAERALKLEPENVDLLSLAGDAYYNSGELKPAREKFTAAFKLKPRDARVRSGLIDTINRQAGDKFADGDLGAAKTYLDQAWELDAEALNTNFNLGLIALENKKYGDAVKHFTVRLKKSPNELLTNRLIAKAYLGAGNEQKAAEHYAKAEAEAKTLRNNRLLAEIYTEWAPLLIQAGKVDDAVEKLEMAVQYASGQPFEKATKRNYQVAVFRRGYERWRQGKREAALEDIEAATKEPALLTTAEQDAFMFGLGLAYLSAGQESKALPIFQDFAKKGSLGFLKPPFDKIGAELFMAYAWYREGSVASRTKAATTFDKLVPKVSGGLQGKLKDLLRSAWEFVAYEQFAAGKVKDAEASLKKAEAYAGAGDKRTIDHNRAVIELINKRSGAKAIFERLGDNPPEALVNLGILVDQEGDAKRAYDLWTAARAKGVRAAKLDEWIEAKKRIFNF